MGKFQAMHKYFAVFLALVACHNSLVTHGRKIKSSNQHYSSLNTQTVAVESQRNPHTILPPLKPSSNVPTASSYKNLNTDIGDSSNTNAFQPTTPGTSPGVGHRNIEGNNVKAMVAVQSSDVEVPVTAGFQPTDPGHSPGVGHSHQNKIGQSN
ncbi:hypothetical protein RJT34_30702 [Clitoria ternatea]|uniref:Encoded peptide n=1 Tax=Clitoria ternatea TaxID=43366 RepID=A0AAN9ESX8_CLITE